MGLHQLRLTATSLINAYASGYFPMAENAQSPELYWYSPDPRAILPLDGTFHIPRSLAKFLRQQPFEITHDRDFVGVMTGCANRPATWINQPILELFTELHQLGYAHSIEAWQNGKIVGGLYGLALGGAFFAESMFSSRSGSSKACLVHLMAHLRGRGFSLCDVQYPNDHLTQFGVKLISRHSYLQQLQQALAQPAKF